MFPSRPAPLPHNTILRSTQTGTISCLWCRKIAGLCNGERTLTDISQALGLPLPVIQKLVQKAVQKGWLLAIDHTASNTFWQQVERQLAPLLGQDSQTLLHAAAHMTRYAPGQIPHTAVTSFLIAVELLAPETARQNIAETLDKLRQEFAA